jgi:hypothetical protein
MKSFENWLTQEVKQTFGLKKVKNHPNLATWLNANHAADAIETTILKKLLDLIEKKYTFWNEDELKFFFISDLINLVNFNDSDDYTCFSQRTLNAHVIDNQGIKVHLRGRNGLLRRASKFQRNHFCLFTNINHILKQQQVIH